MRRTAAALISMVVFAVVLTGPPAPIAQAGGSSTTDCSGTLGGSTECQLLDDLAGQLTAAQAVLVQAGSTVAQAVSNVLDVCVRVNQPAGVPTAEVLALVQTLRAELIALPQLIQGLLGAALGDLVATVDALIAALNAPDPPVEPTTTTSPPPTAPPGPGGGSAPPGGSAPGPTGGSASASGPSSAAGPSASGGAAGWWTGWSQATGSVTALGRSNISSSRSPGSPGVRVGNWLTLSPLLGRSGSGVRPGLDLGAVNDIAAPSLADRAAGVRAAGTGGQTGSTGAGRVLQVGAVVAVIVSLMLLAAALVGDVRQRAHPNRG